MPDRDGEFAPLARVRVERGHGVTRAAVTGELDMSNAGEIHRQLVAATAGSGTLSVDLAGLTFIDSAGIAALDRLHRHLSGGSCELRISAAEGSVAARVLRLAGMDRVLPMDAGEALEG